MIMNAANGAGPVEAFPVVRLVIIAMPWLGTKPRLVEPVMTWL